MECHRVKSKAFMGDKGITSVVSPVNIANKAFANCSNLEEVTISGASAIGIYAFYGCTSLETVDLGSVAKLGTSAFSGCKSLETINLENVQTVGKHAFYGCALTEADLSAATSIGYGAFTGNALAIVKFGSDLESLDPKAFFGYSFYDADGDKLARTVKNLSGNAFEGSDKVLVMKS